MSESERSELISQFAGVTGVDADRAKFYLESAAWKLDVALESFYGDDDGEPSAGADMDISEPAAPAEKSSSKTQSSSQSRIATIASMRDDPDESDSDDDKEAYYAGGSEHGAGQQILGPKKKKDTDALVTDMFKSAKEHGAEEVSPDEPSASQSQRSKPRFAGTAYRLGETEEPSLSIPGFPAQGQGPKQVDMVLKLWKNGFSVNDGPLRSFEQPENVEFLKSIRKGEVPRELIQGAGGGEVNLNMEDHRDEEFVKPKVSIKAFSGEGHRLGSPAGDVVVSSMPNPAGASGGGAAAAAASVPLDASQPTTSLQIRLTDGSRLVAKFNDSHTVSDVRQYINSSRPQFSTATYSLMTTFPNKEITDESQTLKAANLLNAVLVQRIK